MSKLVVICFPSLQYDLRAMFVPSVVVWLVLLPVDPGEGGPSQVLDPLPLLLPVRVARPLPQSTFRLQPNRRTHQLLQRRLANHHSRQVANQPALLHLPGLPHLGSEHSQLGTAPPKRSPGNQISV